MLIYYLAANFKAVTDKPSVNYFAYIIRIADCPITVVRNSQFVMICLTYWGKLLQYCKNRFMQYINLQFYVSNFVFFTINLKHI